MLRYSTRDIILGKDNLINKLHELSDNYGNEQQ